MSLSPLRAVAAGAALFLLVASCSDDAGSGDVGERLDGIEERLDDLEAGQGGTTTGPGGGTPPNADAPPDPEDPATQALVFFLSLEEACAVHASAIGNPPVEPARFLGARIAAMVGDDVFELVDGAGTSLLVQPAAGIVTGPDGGDGVMPRPYAFSCPEDVFIGLLPE
ncbi:hypothetical protein BH20ACT2_BH20ACT2_05610 [soil metagenome]